MKFKTNLLYHPIYRNVCACMYLSEEIFAFVFGTCGVLFRHYLCRMMLLGRCPLGDACFGGLLYGTFAFGVAGRLSLQHHVFLFLSAHTVAFCLPFILASGTFHGMLALVTSGPFSNSSLFAVAVSLYVYGFSAASFQ